MLPFLAGAGGGKHERGASAGDAYAGRKQYLVAKGSGREGGDQFILEAAAFRSKPRVCSGVFLFLTSEFVADWNCVYPRIPPIPSLPSSLLGSFSLWLFQLVHISPCLANPSFLTFFLLSLSQQRSFNLSQPRSLPPLPAQPWSALPDLDE